jgi:carboxyl-terminal processing protease
MTSKVVKIILIITSVIIVIVGAFSGGFLAGNVFSQYSPNSLDLPFLGDSNQTTSPTVVTDQTSTEAVGTPSDLRTLFKPFWESWDIVHKQFVDQPVNDTLLMRGAIKGMLDSLGDNHTSYVDPDMLRQANIQLEGEYEGIGAWVDVTGDFLTIISPMPNSPAEKAGLKPEDQVIKIDGEDMTGLDGNVVLKKVLGPAGTEITLTILRKNDDKPFDVKIIREKIVVPSVTGKMLENNIAYIQISTFGDNTEPELEKNLKELLSKSPSGLVIDLRYNGGGLLSSAIDVASQFIKDDIVMYEQYGDGTYKEEHNRNNGIAWEIPMVVLVNEGTASASEIVAGAIQDYGRAKLVGVQTYGKGSVQNWIELDGNQGAVRVTIARWLTPLKRQINEVGLTPDFIVELSEDDVSNQKDTQLEKAVELLTTQ